MRHRNIVGPRIRDARRKAQPKLTQAELAARMQVAGFNLDRAAIAKIESQRRSVKDIELVGLARALNVSVAWILAEVDSPSEDREPTISGRR